MTPPSRSHSSFTKISAPVPTLLMPFSVPGRQPPATRSLTRPALPSSRSARPSHPTKTLSRSRRRKRRSAMTNGLAGRCVGPTSSDAKSLRSAVLRRCWWQRAGVPSAPDHLYVLMNPGRRDEHRRTNDDRDPEAPFGDPAHQGTNQHTRDHAIDHTDHARDGEDELPAIGPLALLAEDLRRVVACGRRPQVSTELGDQFQVEPP